MHGATESPEISIVTPVRNESGNLTRLVQEIAMVLPTTSRTFEFVMIDDGSTDSSKAELARLSAEHTFVRAYALQSETGRSLGQSAALGAGIKRSKGSIIVTMDGDGQNDPTDIPAMLDLLKDSGAEMVQGDRSADRKDGVAKRWGSSIGRIVRHAIVGRDVHDTGCALRVMTRDTAIALPLHIKGMHRFMAALAMQAGAKVVEMPVRHRARTSGRTKYGVFERAVPGLIDCFGVRWLSSRRTQIGTDPVSGKSAVTIEVGHSADATRGARSETVHV